MSSLIYISKNILLRMLKKPTTFLLHFLLPIVAAIAMFLVMGLIEDGKIAIGINDMDQTDLSAYYIEALEGSDSFNVYPINVGELRDKTIDRSIQIGIEIPKGFSDSFYKDKPLNIHMISLENDQTTAWVSAQSDFYLQNIRSMISSGIDYRTYQQKYNLVQHALQDVSQNKRTLGSVFGVYLLLIMITTFTISFKILDEKNSGTLSRISLAPVPARVYTLANILSNLIITSLQIGILLLSLKIVMKVDFYANLFSIYFVLITFALCAIAVGVLIAASFENSKKANGIMAVILSPTCMLAGCMWPIELMPDLFQKLAYITPQRWTLDALNILFRYDLLYKALPHLLIVLGFATLFFLLAVYQFKNKEII